MEYDMYTDIDASALALFDMGVNEEFEQDSLEVRWTSPGGNRFDYILGFYMHDNEVRNNQPTVWDPTSTFAPGAYGFDQVYTNGSYVMGSDLWSLFVTGTFHISDSWRLTAGVRYTDEEKDYQRESTCLPVRGGVVDFNPSEVDQAIIDANAGAFFCANLDGFSDDRSSYNWMPEVAVEWDLNDEIMWYGKYSESAKSGGWVASTIVAENLINYDDEESNSWELGMRSYLAGGGVALNFALYRTQFDDLQVNSFDQISFAAGVRNAASAISQGIEIDGSWLINDWLTMRAAYAYLDATYDIFEDSPCPISEILAGTPAPCDASGKRLPLAPEHSLSLGFDVNHQLSSGLRFLAGLNLAYTDDYDTDAGLEPALIQSSFTTVGARIGLEEANAKWNVSLVGTNLTDEAILNFSFPVFNNIGFIQPPRMIWLQLTWRFMNF
jgi:outer membrane receptor protein involved in Fe transport